jgi:hypothetical protein
MASRNTDSENLPHDRREIPRRDDHHVPRRHTRESLQAGSCCPARVAGMGDAHRVSSQSLGLLAAFALSAPSCVVDGPPLGSNFCR